MAEWPVRTEDFEPRPYEREPILAGTELVLMRSRGQGGELVGYHFQCPCCGWLYYVPIEGTTVDQDPSAPSSNPCATCAARSRPASSPAWRRPPSP